MTLKSFSLFGRKKKKKKKRLAGDLVTGGVTAIIGLGLLGATASAVRRI